MRAAIFLVAAVCVATAWGQQVLSPGSSAAKTPLAPHHEANFEEERAQAMRLFMQSRNLEGLPLYEDLCRQDPMVGVFAEWHSAGLLAKAGSLQDPKAKREAYDAGIAEARRAASLGDRGPFVEAILNDAARTPLGVALGGPAGMTPLTVGYTYMGTPEARALEDRGQTEFNQHDYVAAEKSYEAAAAADPKWYTAALFTGDAYFRMQDFANAGIWFSKAIALDPDRETAHRYWCDALYSAHDPMGAKREIILAVVAEPYNRAPWAKLQQWAQVTRTPFVMPRAVRPEFSPMDGSIKTEVVTVAETDDGHGEWLVYERVRMGRGAKSASQLLVAGATASNGQQTPTGYVHTLEEEIAALDAMLTDVSKKLADGSLHEERLEPSLKTLLAMRKLGFLEPFVLLNFNDAGLRYGYPAYRQGHRKQIADYLATVVASGVVQ